MKRFVTAAVVALSLLCGSVFADTAVQQDQNDGYLHPATSTFTLTPDVYTDFYMSAPASTTTWLASHTGCQFILLPALTRGFLLNMFDGDAIIGHPDDVATGAYYVGVKVASGSYFKWESRNPNQSAIKFRIRVNGAATGTMTLTAW